MNRVWTKAEVETVKGSNKTWGATPILERRLIKLAHEERAPIEWYSEGNARWFEDSTPVWDDHIIFRVRFDWRPERMATEEEENAGKIPLQFRRLEEALAEDAKGAMPTNGETAQPIDAQHLVDALEIVMANIAEIVRICAQAKARAYISEQMALAKTLTAEIIRRSQGEQKGLRQ
jgi:hypothetical protein